MKSFEGRKIPWADIADVISTYENNGYQVLKMRSATGTSEYGVYKFSSLVTILFVI